MRQRSDASARAPGTPASSVGGETLLPRFYRVLGVTMGASPRDVTHAYRMLAAKWHPDQWATAPEEKQKVRMRRTAVQPFHSVCVR